VVIKAQLILHLADLVVVDAEHRLTFITILK